MQNNLYAADRKVTAIRPGEKGFSILEVIVAMVIFLMVTGTIFGVLQVAQRSRSVVSQKVQLTKNVRFALSMLKLDTYNAGLNHPLKDTLLVTDDRISTLVGIPNDVDTLPSIVPPIIPGNNITLNTFNTNAGVKTDQVTFIFKDSAFNPVVGPTGATYSAPVGFTAAITSPGGIDEINLTPGSNAVFNLNDILVVTGGNGSTLAVVTAKSGGNILRFANGDVLALNKAGTTGPLRLLTPQYSMQRVRMVTYFVTADGILTRREYANDPAQAFVDEPLVYSVENFQIQYVSEDGTLSDNPGAGLNGIAGDGDDTPLNLSKIRQVRFTVNTRSTELDPAGQPYRVNMTSTYSARNLGYKTD